MGQPGVMLVGYRASGKSSVGPVLAAALGIPFADADTLAEARLGRPIAEVFASDGEAVFRDCESSLLEECLAAWPAQGRVLATGGGVVERSANRRLLQASPVPVIYLAAPAAVLMERLRTDAGGRPGLSGTDPVAEVAAILHRRDPWYRAVADRVVDAQAPVRAIVADILRGLGRS